MSCRALFWGVVPRYFVFGNVVVIFVKAVTILRTNKIVQVRLVLSVYCWLLAWEGSVLLVSKFLQVSTKGVPNQGSIKATLRNWVRRVRSFSCDCVQKERRLNQMLR